MRIPLRQQIEEVERELRLREQVYPGLIHRGKLRRAEAEFHLKRLEAVRDTLRWLEGLLDEHGRAALPDVVRAVVGNDEGGE